MHPSLAGPPASHRPTWLFAAAGLGTLWNAYGVYQFVGSFTPAGRAAMVAGMTPAAAQAYQSLPLWVSVVFAVGVFGGALGAVALALRSRAAQSLLAASFIGYCLLFAGDALHGVFEGAPAQLATLAAVVCIAAALSWVAWLAGRRGLLR